MKIYVKSDNHAGYYLESETETYRNKEYHVQYSFVNSTDEDEIFSKFEAQITEIHPYDEADYYWAKIKNGVISYVQNSRTTDKEYYFKPSDMGVEVEDWYEEVALQAIKHLYDMNKNINPEMSYD